MIRASFIPAAVTILTLLAAGHPADAKQRRSRGRSFMPPGNQHTHRFRRALAKMERTDSLGKCRHGVRSKKRAARWESAGGVVYDPSKKKIALVKNKKERRQGTNGWTLAKGRVDAGESPRQAAAREVREESGLSSRPAIKLGTLRSSKALRHYFLMIREEGSKDGVHDRETLKVKWVGFKKAKKMLQRKRDRRVLGWARETLKALERQLE